MEKIKEDMKRGIKRGLRDIKKGRTTSIKIIAKEMNIKL